MRVGAVLTGALQPSAQRRMSRGKRSVRTLPPIGVAPGVQRLPNRGVMPGVPQAIPQPMPPRRRRAASSRPEIGPRSPTSDTGDAGPGSPRPLVLDGDARAHIPRVPGRIGSVEAIGPVAATTPSAVAMPTSTRVYVINGVDPFGWGGLAADDRAHPRERLPGHQVRRRGSRCSSSTARSAPPTARIPSRQFVIIGYSFGVYRAKALANRLSRDGIPIAMVGYIGGDYLRNTPRDCKRAARAS